MTLTQFSFACLLSVIGLSCCGPKKTFDQTTVSESGHIEAPAFEVSASAKRLFAAIEKELKESTGDLATYATSKTVVDEFGLREQQGQFMITGFIRTTPAFDPAIMEALGGSSGTSSGGMRTVSLPVKQINHFLQIKTIEYFELAAQATNK